MKKLLLGLVAGLIGLMTISAQNIPEGRELFPAVYDFATDYENAWTFAKITNFDVQNNDYSVTGYAVSGKGITLHRDDYKVGIKKDGNTFTVTISDYTTVACDKSGKILAKAKKMSKSKGAANQLSGFIAKDISERLSKWSNEEYQQKVDVVITNPEFLGILSEKSSNLYVSRFVKKYGIEGKEVKLSLVLKSIKENPLKDDQILKYANKLSGAEPTEEETYDFVVSGYISNNPFASMIEEGGLSIITPDEIANRYKSSNVVFYTNNEELIEKQEGDVFEIQGTIKKLSFNDTTGKFILYQVFDSVSQ